MKRGRIQRLPKFFGYPLLSRERVKLRTINLAGTFIGLICLLKIFQKRERGRIQGLSNFLGTPYIISGTDKATDFKFCRNIQRVDPNKSP